MNEERSEDEIKEKLCGTDEERMNEGDAERWKKNGWGTLGINGGGAGINGEDAGMNEANTGMN